MTDEQELRWWREVFATRLAPGSQIKPGTPMFGMRVYLMAQCDDGERRRHLRQIGPDGGVPRPDSLDSRPLPAYLAI